MAVGPALARPALLWSAVGTKTLATLPVASGLELITPISWAWIGLVWGYCIACIFVEDWAKLAVYRHPATADAATRASCAGSRIAFSRGGRSAISGRVRPLARCRSGSQVMSPIGSPARPLA